MLKKIRETHGFTTITSLSKASGVSDSMIGSIERGERAPGICTLSKLARVFGMSIDELSEKLRNQEGDNPDEPAATAV